MRKYKSKALIILFHAIEFFYSIEAKFVKHYQFMTCYNGPDEILFSSSGDYKSIMWTGVKDSHDYLPLISSVFTKQELTYFYNTFKEIFVDYEKEDLLEMIGENPKW